MEYGKIIEQMISMNQSFSEKYNGKKVSDIFKEYVFPGLELYLEGGGDFNADELEQML